MAKKFDWLYKSLKNTNLVSNDRLRHPDEGTYLILQASGLMYGISSSDPYQLFSSFVTALYNTYSHDTSPTEEISGEEFCQDIVEFYKVMFPTAFPINWFNKMSLATLAKRTLINRCKITQNRIGKSLNQSLFMQSALLIEVLLFQKYIITKKDSTVLNYLAEERANMFLTCTMIISAAAQANRQIANEERTFYNAFIKKSILSSTQRQAVLATLDGSIRLEEIELSEYTSWVYRKFLSEIAWFTIWSDGKLDEPERSFMEQLALYLHITPEDLELSGFAVESYLLIRANSKPARQNLIQRLKGIILLHEQTIVSHIGANRELMDLLRKGNITSLSDIDQKSLQYKLIIEVQKLPAFRYILLSPELLSYQEVVGLFSKNMIRALLS